MFPRSKQWDPCRHAELRKSRFLAVGTSGRIGLRRSSSKRYASIVPAALHMWHRMWHQPTPCRIYRECFFPFRDARSWHSTEQHPRNAKSAVWRSRHRRMERAIPELTRCGHRWSKFFALRRALLDHSNRLVVLANRHVMPAICANRNAPAAGRLMELWNEPPRGSATKR